MKNKHRTNRPRRRGWVALLPLVLLGTLMGGMGSLLGDFSKVPMTVVFILTSLAALCTLRGFSIDERIKVFSVGAGQSDLLLMVWIFILAGAFASSASAMGAVSATVDLTLRYLPSNFLLAVLFLASCIVSLCIGTSVGTIVALVPMASEMAERTDMFAPVVVAVVVGGAFFGDNLSFISDTTVAATRTQGCMMRDKFRTNFRIVAPAAVLCLLIYIIMGITDAPKPYEIATNGSWVELLRTLPYLMVLITALLGINVMAVLTIGCALTGLVGMTLGSYDMGGFLLSLAKGVSSMGDLILISMMAGGLLAVVRKGGGVTWLVRGLTRRVRSRRGAELCISALVSFTNLCTANNTVAILSVGSIAKDISERYGVDKRRAASLLDIFSCVVQGIIPYGAQLLMASGLAALSPIAIIPHLYYPMLIGIAAVGSIFVVKDKKR